MHGAQAIAHESALRRTLSAKREGRCPGLQPALAGVPPDQRTLIASGTPSP